MGRVANVYFENRRAGVLTEDDDYRFEYQAEYLVDGTPLSIHLPLQKSAFVSDELFPFFENLLAEGWLRRLQSQQQKIDEGDRFGLLLANGKDLVGAVTVEPAEQ